MKENRMNNKDFRPIMAKVGIALVRLFVFGVSLRKKRYLSTIVATSGIVAAALFWIDDAIAQDNALASPPAATTQAQDSVSDPAPFTDSAAPEFTMPQSVSATPRSLSLADAFAEQNVLDLPALAEDDFVDNEANPPIIGRVYEVVASPAHDGQWTELPEGGRLWTLTVRSPNAVALRLRFEPFNPPRTAGIIVYNAHDPLEAYGPIGSERRATGSPPRASPAPPERRTPPLGRSARAGRLRARDART